VGHVCGVVAVAQHGGLDTCKSTAVTAVQKQEQRPHENKATAGVGHVCCVVAAAQHGGLDTLTCCLTAVQKQEQRPRENRATAGVGHVCCVEDVAQHDELTTFTWCTPAAAYVSRPPIRQHKKGRCNNHTIRQLTWRWLLDVSAFTFQRPPDGRYSTPTT
jgi:hypothetical protein